MIKDVLNEMLTFQGAVVASIYLDIYNQFQKSMDTHTKNGHPAKTNANILLEKEKQTAQ